MSDIYFEIESKNEDIDIEISSVSGSGGHTILNEDGIALPQRNELQFINATTIDENGLTIVSGNGEQGERGSDGADGAQGIQGVQGDKGDKGADGQGTGDMLKSIYDTNDNGIVDNSEKLGGQLPNHYAKTTDLEDKVDKIAGKGLSGNDFTDALKAEYDGYSTGKANTGASYLKSETYTKTETDLLKLPNPHALTFTGATTGNYDGSVAMEVSIPEGGGGSSIYDQVIRTQAEFEALIASPTWLDAKSVCFIGDGGTLKFTRATTGNKIPQTVKNIKGLNNAILEVTDFAFHYITNKAVLWCETLPTTDDYSIDGIEAICTVADLAMGFHSCTNLTNCTGSGTSVTSSVAGGYGFHTCTNLTNCTGNGSSTGVGNSSGVAFSACDKLTNCTGRAESRRFSRAFEYCEQLTNCTGNANSGHPSTVGYTSVGFASCTQLTNCTAAALWTSNAHGFDSCTQLTNCASTASSYNVTGTSTGYGFRACTQLTNCAGIGNASGIGYSFFSCHYLNGCKQSGASATAFLGGTNTKVDTLTVAAT